MSSSLIGNFGLTNLINYSSALNTGYFLDLFNRLLMIYLDNPAFRYL